MRVHFVLTEGITKIAPILAVRDALKIGLLDAKNGVDAGKIHIPADKLIPLRDALAPYVMAFSHESVRGKIPGKDRLVGSLSRLADRALHKLADWSERAETIFYK